MVVGSFANRAPVLLQANACNAYEINEFVKKGDSMINCESREVGGAVYPTIRYVALGIGKHAYRCVQGCAKNFPRRAALSGSSNIVRGFDKK